MASCAAECPLATQRAVCCQAELPLGQGLACTDSSLATLDEGSCDGYFADMQATDIQPYANRTCSEQGECVAMMP